ncbi:MAG: fatty acid desaturase [Acidimicrobiales bacterium]
MATSVLPSAQLLPDVLPTARLNPRGRPLPPIRDELRRIAGARNALSVAGALAQSVGVVVVAAAVGRWWAYVLAFFLAGRGFALLNILGHEAAHRLLFERRGTNDAVGRWLLAYPAFTPFDVYRRVHMAHHRDELGPDEPDQRLYAGYPITPASWARKLGRDAAGISGWKNLKPLLVALAKPGRRRVAVRILAAQAAVAAVLTLAGWFLAGAWWLYPVCWLAPWMTVWRVLNRLRAVAEHGGMARSEDRRLTTHVVRQRPLARFWIVPYNTGWHLAHHVDSGIPWRNLPRLHRELVASGWVTPGLEYRSYPALWRALASRVSLAAAG